MSRRDLKSTVHRYLGQGQRPTKLAWSVATGAVLGLFPIPGAATLLCVLTAVCLRLNHVVVQACNYAVYPLQLGMLGIYYALGNLWFGSGQVQGPLAELSGLLTGDILSGIQAMGQVALPVVSVWFFTSPLLALVLFVLVRPAMVRMQAVLSTDERGPVSIAKQQLPAPVAARLTLPKRSFVHK
jgi:uncharacterized protein (DUF2062 family)